MRIAILSANLNSFDRVQEPVKQSVDCDWHCFTDEDFPPITGLTPRLQYRIPKTHGWQMMPDHDYYIWLDGSMTMTSPDTVKWLLNQLSSNDMAFFKHPDRKTIREEVDYLEARKDHPYISSRYKNGLHLEQMAEIEASDYEDEELWASTVFVYKPTDAVKKMMHDWLYTSVRYFTCDQVALPYLAWKHGVCVSKINVNPFKNSYLTVGSKHK